MADILISDLGAMAEAVHKDNDMLALQNVSSGETVKVSTQQLLDTVSSLTAMTDAVATTDVLVIHDTSAGVTKKVTPQQLFDIVPSLVIKGRDGGDIGGYIFDGVNDYVTIPNRANFQVGTGDFSTEWYGVVTSTVDLGRMLFCLDFPSNARGYDLYIRTGETLYTRIGDGTNLVTSDAITIPLNTPLHIVVTYDRDGDLTIYVNGISSETKAISTVTGAVNPATAMEFGRDLDSTYAKEKTFIVRLYNKVLSATEIASIYNNGRPDLYELVYSDKNANNTSLTSGTLTIGKRYRLKDFIAGDDFTNVGAASNADGVEFIATGTTPTTWTNSSEVVPIGCVAEYLPQNAGSLGWIESSGNQLSGSTSGSPLCINKENRPPHYRDIRKTIAANTDTTLTGIVPKGYKIVSIRAKGSDSLADIKIGSASAGEQIVAATTTSSTTPKLLTLAATANDAYSESADVTLYARHDTSASGKTMDLIFHFEKVGN